MGPARRHLVSLLIYVFVVTEIRFPQVTCQDEEGTQCIPKRAFLALLRLPEVSSNLAAYSRTARVIQDAKNRNDMAHLKALTEEGDDTEMCIPGGVYLELFRDPALRGHLSVIGRTQKLPDFPGRLLEDSEEIYSRDLMPESEKRSIATLAKNDDLPISIQDRMGNEDDEEKRSSGSSEQPEGGASDVLHEYLLPSGELDLDALAQDFPITNWHIGSFARNFALPTGRRNVASLARDHGLPNGKRNIGALARDRMLPSYGKRNVAALAKNYMFPQNGKRNVAALARDYSLPYGKRYLGSLARTNGMPFHEDGKRSVAILAKNSDWPDSSKRGLTPPGSLILRTLSRHGRSLTGHSNSRSDSLISLEELANQNSKNFDVDSFGVVNEGFQGISRSNRRNEIEKRSKRQIDFSDEYPLPVMQNTNMLDYEEMMEELTEQYPNTEKRFMGRIPQMGPRPTTPPTRRHGR